MLERCTTPCAVTTAVKDCLVGAKIGRVSKCRSFTPTNAWGLMSIKSEKQPRKRLSRKQREAKRAAQAAVYQDGFNDGYELGYRVAMQVMKVERNGTTS